MVKGYGNWYTGIQGTGMAPLTRYRAERDNNATTVGHLTVGEAIDGDWDWERSRRKDLETVLHMS